MANLTPTPGWDNVLQLETDTPVLGGPGGPDNAQAQALLNRFAFLEGATGSSKVGHTPAGTGAVATTVNLKLDESPSPADRGAIGDGVTDDTVALQLAIDLLTDGQELNLCGKTYLISKGAARVEYPNGDQPCLVVYQKTNIKITNGKLLVNTHGLGAIDFKDSPNCRLDGVTIEGYGNFPPLDGTTGRGEKGTATEGYYDLTFDQNGPPRNNSIDSSAYTTGGYGGAFPREGGGTGATWGTWGGGFIQNYGFGVYVLNSDNVVISNCDISGFNGSAVGTADSAGVVVGVNNKLHDNYTGGVEIFSTNTRADCSISVFGNHILNNGHPDAVITDLNFDPGYGVATNNGSAPFESVSVQNNIIVGNKRKGVDSHSSKQYTVVGNTITDSGFGINLYAGSDSVLDSAVVVGNHVKRIANCKGENTLGISVYGDDTLSAASIVISGNYVEDMGVPASIVDNGVALSSWAIHAANANAIAVTGNVVKNPNYIGQAGIVIPQSDTQPVTNAVISGNTVFGKFAAGFIGATTANTKSRPFLIGNRFSLSAIAPYTDVPVGINSVDAMIGLNAIDVPDVAGAELTIGTKSTNLQLKITVVITAGEITFAVDSNFELFGKTPVSSVVSVAEGFRISFAGWLPPPRNVQITRKSQIVKRLTGDTLINAIYEHDIQAGLIDIGLAIQDYTTNTSVLSPGNNSEGIIAVYVGF